MNSETVCEICSHLISSPTVLTCCFSSVCADCLRKITVKDPKRSSRPCYKCPFCSKDQTISSSTKPNVFLSRYIEFCYKKGKLQNVTCGQCQQSIKSTDAHICGACGNQYFCKDCNSTVHNTEATKSHVRTSVNTVLKNYSGSLNKTMMCHLHMKEKIEFICLKDFATFCKTCVPNHKRSCKDHKVVSLEKAHIELAALLSKKISEVNNCRDTADGEYSTIKQKLDEFNTGFDEKISSIEKYFNELREILNTKEKEIKATVEQIFNSRKISLNREVHSLENVNFRIESLIDIVEFAMSYPSTFFCEGANYLLQRLNRLSDSDPHIRTVRPSNLPELELFNMEYCKTALGRLSIEEVLPGLHNQLRSSNIMLNEDLSPELESSPTSPNADNFSIFHEVKKRTHIKTQSIVAQYQGKYPSSPSKPASNPETKTSSPQREITPISMRPDSYKNLIAKLKKTEQMDKSVGNDSLQRLRIIKDHNSTSTASLSGRKINLEKDIGLDSHRGCSRTPISKCASLKYWGESPKYFKTCNSQDHLWTLALSPTIKEANPFSEQDQMILEVQKNPLIKRKFMKIAQTANSIFVSWPNVIDNNNVIYQLDYGVGSKVQNVEQFRTAFKGSGESHVISGLMPATKYRLRICPILLKESTTECDTSSSAHSTNNGDVYGPWSDVVTVLTKDLQTIDSTSVGSYATVSMHGKDTIIDFEKPGKVVAKNEYEYEKTAWEIRFPQNLAHRCPLDSNSFIKVGVTNKSGKAYNIVGSVINYGLSSEAFVIKVFLDLENRTMVVYNSNNKSKEFVNNLPIGPLYPAFQNKTSKDSNFPLKLNIKFDLPYTLNEIKDLE